MDTCQIPDIEQIEIHTLDTSSTGNKYLIHYQGRYFEVSEAVVVFIRILKRSASLAEAAEHLSAAKKRIYTENDIQKLLETCIYPILAVPAKPKRTFLFKKDLIHPSFIRKFTAVFKWLFQDRIAIPLLAIVICLEALFFAQANAVFYFGDVTPLLLACVLGLYLISSLFHELGHASACHYFGIPYGAVGFGLYINFPVFYTDVSAVWYLGRKQRLIVNLAGIYFQLLWLIPFLVLYFYTHNEIIKYFIFTININFAITLNPFFKFDGYWIASDLLGVPNLRSRTYEVFKYWFRKIRGRKPGARPFLFTMRPVEKTFMVAYSVVVNFFFGYYFCYFIPVFIYSFCKTFPTTLQTFVGYAITGSMPPVSVLRNFFGQLIMMGLTLYFLYSLLNSIIQYVFSERAKRSAASVLNSDE